jgi:hypothetical protein
MACLSLPRCWSKIFISCKISLVLEPPEGKISNVICTVENQYRKLGTNIPRKGIAQPQSQFAHSCVCERIIHSYDRSAYSAAGNMWTDPGNI